MTTLLLLRYAATFMLSLSLALYLTPIVRRIAERLGILDHPDGGLKQHATPTPYLGGIVVYLSFLVTLSLIFDFQKATLGLLLGGTMLAMLGLFDDLKAAGPYLKLLMQLLAAWVAVKSDITIHLAMIPPVIALPLTILWLMGVTNATNILDVSDGLVTGTSLIAALAFFVVGVLDSNTLLASASLALAGSLAGFLPSNWPIARIYLGDTGSLFTGFMLASFGMLGSYTRTNTVAAVAPLIILFVPLFETTLVVIARLARGGSPLRGSRDHLALRLKARGWSTTQVNQCAYGLAVYGAASGIATMVGSAAVAHWAVGLAAVVFITLGAWLLAACPAPTVASPSRASTR